MAFTTGYIGYSLLDISTPLLVNIPSSMSFRITSMTWLRGYRMVLTACAMARLLCLSMRRCSSAVILSICSLSRGRVRVDLHTSQVSQQIIRDTVATRQKFAARFVDLARASGHTGEPMLRNLEYNYPGMGYAAVRDQFMMGTDLLVAPIVEKGQTERKVVIPPGTWISDEGETVVGPKTVTVKTPLSRLPYFTLKR